MKWDFAELTNTGNTGDATKGTAEKGEKMTAVLMDCVVDAVKNWMKQTGAIAPPEQEPSDRAC